VRRRNVALICIQPFAVSTRLFNFFVFFGPRRVPGLAALEIGAKNGPKGHMAAAKGPESILRRLRNGSALCAVGGAVSTQVT